MKGYHKGSWYKIYMKNTPVENITKKRELILYSYKHKN